jgi:hypothetical protein
VIYRHIASQYGSKAKFAVAIILPAAVLAISGCGGDKLGRHAVSGTITFKGKPVPKGFVRLIPDSSKGTRGPGGGGPIKNGKFHAPANKGVVAGAYLIEIDGLDGVPTQEGGEELADGKALFPMVRVEHEFPDKDSVWDYEVSK